MRGRQQSVGEPGTGARRQAARAAVGGAQVGRRGVRPEALAHVGLVHQAEQRGLAVEQPDERAPQRRAHDEGARAVDRVDHPPVARRGAGGAEFLADETVLGKAARHLLAHGALGAAIGGRDRVEGPADRLVLDGDGRAEVRQNLRARPLGEPVRELQQREGGAVWSTAEFPFDASC